MSLPSPGPIALRAASDAEANIGVTESGGNNRGKYVEIYLKASHAGAGDPWCAAFANYREKQADAAIFPNALPADWPDSAYCPDYRNWAVSHGVWIPVSRAVIGGVPVVMRGDLCLFYFASKARVAHIGIVVEVHEWGCYTVEGNTGPEQGDPAAVNRDGDGVYRKKREWKELGSGGGFVRLGF